MATSDRSKLRRTLQALCLSAALCAAAPALADNLPEVQRLIRQGQYPQALEKVDAYLETRPKDAQGRFLKGLILTEMNRPNDAIALFTKLTEDYPELPEPYNNLAVLYAQQKQYDRARTALEMAIRTHPSYAIAYENLGDVYAKLASQAYDKALQLDSSNAAAQNKLALIRDLVSTPGKPGARPATVAAATPAAAPAAPAASAPAAPRMPVATVVTTTPGAATPGATTKSPPAATPTAPATPAPEALDPAVQEVSRALAAWAAAWSKQDVKGYLSFYAPNFDTPKGMSRKAWEQERRERISRPSWIKVSYDPPKISVDGNKATVRIRQHYQASNFKSSSSKTLVFTKSGNSWLILSEDSR
ncbi:MAG: tetratricopeptide repeat protein [Azovibrio sp.]|uniref:L,D-transpeptidase Cds6 family protein n=3 Tax=Azovibrio sp. TaxID=1872673 RepID=UPI003C755AC6